VAAASARASKRARDREAKATGDLLRHRGPLRHLKLALAVVGALAARSAAAEPRGAD